MKIALTDVTVMLGCVFAGSLIPLIFAVLDERAKKKEKTIGNW